MKSASGGADLGEEIADLALQPLGLLAERLGRRFDALCGRPGGIGARRDAADALGDVARALRRRQGVAGDLLGRGALLLDRDRDRARHGADLADRAANAL